MDLSSEFREEYPVSFTKAMLLFVNDSLRFVHVDEPKVIESRAEEKNLSQAQKEAWAGNNLKHKVIALLQQLVNEPDDSKESHEFKISPLEAEILENLTTNSLEDQEVQRLIDLEVQPHLLVWLSERTLGHLADGGEAVSSSDTVTHAEARDRASGQSAKGEGGSQGPNSSPDHRRKGVRP